MPRPSALVAAHAMQDGANSEGIVAVTTKGLAGKVGMEQLDPRQPGLGQQPVGIHLRRP